MAKGNSTTPKRGIAKTRHSACVRASEREGIKLDVAASALRDLMTEACRQPFGWATFYSGARAELTAAGFPEYLFPQNDKRNSLRINGRDAFIQRKGRTYELTLHWDHDGPWYHSAGHPALAELARMILIDASWWIDSGEREPNGWKPTDEVATRKLIECEAAVDYRLPASRRFKFAPGFREEISRMIMQIHHAIRSAEIMPLEPAPVKYDEPRDDNVVDINVARAVSVGSNSDQRQA